jgi:hypothetical protein
MDCKMVTAISLLALCVLDEPARSAEGARIVRIPAPIAARCINAKTDELTVTLRYIKTEKRQGFFTQDNKAGITVLTALNSDGNPRAQNPSVNLVDISDASTGQIYLPMEYPIASLLALSPDSGKTFTKNIELEIYIDRVKGQSTFGKILDVAGQLLPKLPIPQNPYTNAVSSVIGFASTAIQKETTDNGGQLFAGITLQFNNRDELNIDQCVNDGFESTGVVGVIGAKGPNGSLELDRLNSYCLRYNPRNTYEIQYTERPNDHSCPVDDASYKDVPNDYLMLVVAARRLLPASPAANVFSPTVEGRLNPAAESLFKRGEDVEESRKLCEALKLAPAYCGAN